MSSQTARPKYPAGAWSSVEPRRIFVVCSRWSDRTRCVSPDRQGHGKSRVSATWRQHREWKEEEKEERNSSNTAGSHSVAVHHDLYLCMSQELIQCNQRDIHWWHEPLVDETFISYCACASLTLAGRGLGWRTSISEWQSSNTLPRKTDSNRHRRKDWSLNTLLNNAVRIHQSQPPSIYNRLVLLYHCRSVYSVISCSLVCIT